MPQNGIAKNGKRPVLDLFYGLGIAAGEVLQMGAARVVAFEKPFLAPPIQGLLRFLPTPQVVSVGIEDAR
eukprot:5468477-Amphidinium_carterae.1